MTAGAKVDKIKVLVVDECAVARHGLLSILRTQGDIEAVGEAADWVEALSQAELLRPTVILMDAKLAYANDGEPIRRIKERMPNVKILCLTVAQPGDRAGPIRQLRCPPDEGRRTAGATRGPAETSTPGVRTGIVESGSHRACQPTAPLDIGRGHCGQLAPPVEGGTHEQSHFARCCPPLAIGG